MSVTNSLRSMGHSFVAHGRALSREICGASRRYGIRGGYRHREESPHFDDTSFTDEFQREVYVRAEEIARTQSVRTVYDVGCGSGYKLVKYLGAYETTGFDVPKTIAVVKERYPDRRWGTVDFSERALPPADLVICSDVIEHVADPDELMALLQDLSGRWLVMSTPDRNRAYPVLSPFRLGPPASDYHVREWSFREFGRYVAGFASVLEHVHPNPEHATQMIVARTSPSR